MYEDSASASRDVSVLEWTDILERLGHGKRRVMEIPNPVIVDDQPLERGIDVLESAMTLLVRGQNEEAFKKCRDVLDATYPLFNSSPSPTPVQFSDQFIDQIDKDSKPAMKSDGQPYPNKSTHVDGIRRALRDFSHIGHHGSYKISPEDAELMVYLCWDIVSFLSKELTRSKGQWP